MKNLSVSWSTTQFNSKEEARTFCTSKEFDGYVSYLQGMAYSLSESGRTEVAVRQGMGCPYESPSSMEAGYCSAEADRLVQLGKYFRGEDPKPGYVWEYSTHGLHSVFQKIDTSNLTPKHPVFLEYIKEQNLNKKEHKEAYSLWVSQFKPSVSQMDIHFKLAYHFKIKNLIPDGTNLLSMSNKKKS